ncbi:uncharacterized protein EI90DRAFT_3040717 [Cantharellus anzutake]|uniref:uncharacterized protein n=1 Tax=Cantharellus anzutake TaxID=1750568 RepID=UPI001908CD61|nr:uncharacterized protein EI90DRAFT_3040717 [Cantharellus anzutake]KAF8339181.1 hypothetical protein EI90DRAFT_3040717 [Cantharellus anzutake]
MLFATSQSRVAASWYSYLSVLVITFLLQASGVFSAPPASSSKCVAYASGYLTTNELLYRKGDERPTHVWKPFSLNSKNELAYWNNTGHGHEKLWVQFQKCTPNWAGATNIPDPIFPNEAQYYGRVYIPKLSLCLGVPNADNSKGPYYVKALRCPNSVAGEMKTKKSIPFNFMHSTFTQDTSRKLLYWVGKYKLDPNAPWQGGCEDGIFGYVADPLRVPITQGSEHRVSIDCSNNAARVRVFAELRPSV